MQGQRSAQRLGTMRRRADAGEAAEGEGRKHEGGARGTIEEGGRARSAAGRPSASKIGKSTCARSAEGEEAASTIACFTAILVDSMRVGDASQIRFPSLSVG